MSDYPVWWDSTITLYNKYVDPQTRIVRWFRHVISNCFVDNTPNMMVSGTVISQSNDVICRIRKSDIYRDKATWNSMFNDEMGGYFTLSQGDIVVFGEVDDVIDETASGHRANDIISKYKDMQGCILVKRYSDNTGEGRCMPHYYVVGE